MSLVGSPSISKVRTSVRQVIGQNGILRGTIAKPKTRNIIEVQVDAKTGKIVSTQTETPTEQRLEAKRENK